MLFKLTTKQISTWNVHSGTCLGRVNSICNGDLSLQEKANNKDACKLAWLWSRGITLKPEAGPKNLCNALHPIHSFHRVLELKAFLQHKPHSYPPQPTPTPTLALLSYENLLKPTGTCV